MIIDIASLHEATKSFAPIPLSAVAMVYLVCTMAISKLYFVQAYKFLRGSNGAGDYCFTTKVGQAMLRLAGLVYSIYINDGTLFLVIALDFVGRWIEISAAYLAKKRAIEFGDSEGVPALQNL